MCFFVVEINSLKVLIVVFFPFYSFRFVSLSSQNVLDIWELNMFSGQVICLFVVNIFSSRFAWSSNFLIINIISGKYTNSNTHDFLTPWIRLDILWQYQCPFTILTRTNFKMHLSIIVIENSNVHCTVQMTLKEFDSFDEQTNTTT